MTNYIKIFSILLLCSNTYFITKAQQWGDYTLIAQQNGSTATLQDTNDVVKKTWTLTGKTGYSSYVLPGGFLLRAVARTGNSFTGGPICGEVQKVDFNGNLVWDYIYSTAQYCTHHDIHPMPNGNVLLIAYEARTAAECTAAGCTTTLSQGMWPDKIVEIKPTGATTGDVVWEWKIWDHLVQNVDASKANYKSSILDNPQLMNINCKPQKDWVHMNGVDYNPILDQVIFSSHNLNEWFIIDHSTTTAEAAGHSGGNSGKGGDFLYRWGSPSNYGATGTQVLKVTHDAHWVPEGVPGAGDIVGFNNQGVSTSKSAVDRITPPVNGYNYNYTSGTAYEPSTYTRHAANGYSSNMGNSQQLPNGNQLVCLATAATVYEISPNGTTLWTKTFTGGSVPQSTRYLDCYIKKGAPPIPSITENKANKSLSTISAATYQWYKNGKLIVGANSQTYSAGNDSGVYVVRITADSSCVYRYSYGFKYNLNGSGGGTNSINLTLFKDVKLIPNPSKSNVEITGMDKFSNYTIQLISAQGNIVFQKNNIHTFNMKNFDNGIYYLKIINIDGFFTTKKLFIQHD